MHLNKLYVCLFVTLLLITLTTTTDASPAPSPPDSGTIWNSGDKVTISWTENKASPLISDMSGINIQLMTGADLSQVPLVEIAKGLATDQTSYSWTVPPLSDLGFPAGKIYFIMFSDSSKPGSGVSWSTRFTILDGKAPVVTYNPTSPFTITKSGGSSSPTAPPSGTTTVVVTANITTSTTSSTSSTPNVVTLTEDDTPTQSPTIPPLVQNSGIRIQSSMHIINIASTLLLLCAGSVFLTLI
ncbi:223_t:CDS:2 [Ambispora gerdemannii]|uniref:223_t:CDS:1 n=1 Tax=Ambispora gerdemannii TaxID=144530 RepID=A0A9N9B6I6_9GLOM|nr:223_t:CDS:2 [Ambispora gerdemannii]